MKALSMDIYSDVTGKKWSAAIRRHPEGGGPGVIAWKRENMTSEHNATSGAEAAWRKLCQ